MLSFTLHKFKKYSKFNQTINTGVINNSVSINSGTDSFLLNNCDMSWGNSFQSVTIHQKNYPKSVFSEILCY